MCSFVHDDWEVVEGEVHGEVMIRYWVGGRHLLRGYVWRSTHWGQGVLETNGNILGTLC